MNENQEGQTQEGEVDFETEARDMGWVAEEEFKGPKDKWVDAKTFVERGEQILPIVKAHNKQLKNDLLTRDKEIANLKSAVENSNKAIAALQKHHTEATKKAVEQAEKNLREQLRQAREVGDVDAEEQIRDQLADIRDAKKDAKNDDEGNKGTENNQQTLSPEFVSWQKENPWFADYTTPENKKRTKAIMRIGEDLRDDGDTTFGRPFMDKCMKILEEQEGKSSNLGNKKVTSKVEGSVPGARQATGSRPFDSLTKEEKQACHEDNETFVGPGKMFKTVKEWEDHFATLYTKE